MLATSKYVPDFAAENGIQKKLMYRVIKNESVNVDVRNLISDTIKKPITEIWPELAEEDKE